MREGIGGAAGSVALLLLVSGCADVPDPTAEDTRGEVSAPIQKGTLVPAAEALQDGVVLLDAPAGVGELPGLSVCTGTMIGPRTLLTAEHCVRRYDETSKKWLAGAKATLTVSVPGDPTPAGANTSTLWSSGRCSLQEGLPAQPTPLPSSAPKLSVLRPFVPGGFVLPRLLPRRTLLPAIQPRCPFASLGDPRADVSVVRLPLGLRPYPVWPTRTAIDGGPTSEYIETTTPVECVGYGKNLFPAPGQPGDAGIARLGVERMTQALGQFADGWKPPVGSTALLPLDSVDVNKAGQVPDRGDSGAGCVVRPALDVAERRIVGVATTGHEAVTGGPVLVATAARTDTFLPWLERVAFAAPNSFGAAVDTVVPRTAPGVVTQPDGTVTGWDWDDGRNFFADLTGDDLDDFIYFGDDTTLYLQRASGDGTFGALEEVARNHLPGSEYVALARWGITPKPVPQSRGYRTRFITAAISTEGTGKGVLITALWWSSHLQESYAPIGGDGWVRTVSVDAAPFFDSTADAVIVRRLFSGPTIPDDHGAVAVLSSSASGAFDAAKTRYWSVPGEAYRTAPFSYGDIDGDGGAELIADMGAFLHVFRALPTGPDPWVSTPVLVQVPPQCKTKLVVDGPEALQRTGIRDVTGDGRADYVCVNGNETGILVMRGLPSLQFDAAVSTPFEISGYVGQDKHSHPWHDANLVDIDGDGLRDYVTFFDDALWFKLNDSTGNQNSGFHSTGSFGAVQRFQMPASGKASFGLSFDALRVRTTIPRSIAMVTYRPDGTPVIREMPAWPTQDR